MEKSQMSAENVARTYRFYAPLYDKVFGAVLEPGRKELTKRVNELAPASLLEVGVGTGLTLNQFSENTKIVGIDLSDEMLEIARLRAKALPDRDIELFSMDAERMNFADHSFDCVAVPYVLSVTPNPDQFVAEIRRVCKPDGTIFILNHFSGSRFWWCLEQSVGALAHRIGFHSEFSFEENILKHSWQVQDVQTCNLMGLSKLVTLKNSNPH